VNIDWNVKEYLKDFAFVPKYGEAVLDMIDAAPGTLAVDGTPAGYRWLNILSNYLGFGLSPGVCLCLVYVMDRKKRMNRWFRAAVCCRAAK